MKRARLTFSIVILILFVFPTLARADDPLERARALYEQAGVLEAEGRWAEAQARLRDAIAIHETANLRYALGWALERGGRSVDARREYEAAKAIAERTGNEEVVRLSTGRLSALARPPPPPDPVVARGRTTPPAAAEPSLAVPWALVIAGGALVTTGVAFVASSAHDSDESDAATARWCAATACASGSVATKAESPEAVRARNQATEAASRGNVKQGIGFTAGALGIVSAAVGAYLFVRASSKDESRLSVGASITPGSAGGAISVRF